MTEAEIVAKLHKLEQLEKMEKDYLSLRDQNRVLQEEVESLRSQLEWFRKWVFGAKSEKSSKVLQDGIETSLFPEEEPPLPKQEERYEERTIKEHTRRVRKQPTLEDLEKVLHVEEDVIQIPEDKRICPDCGKPMTVMAKEYVRTELVRIPAQVYLLKIFREVMTCKAEAHDDKAMIVKAKPPTPAIEHSFASPSTIAYVMEQKFRYGKTLYRMEGEWADLGVPVSRQTMSNWILRAANDWLLPVVRRLKQELFRQAIIHADETTFPVLPEKGNDRHQVKTCYAWVLTTGSYEKNRRIALYTYQPGRRKEDAVNTLEGYHGILETDGYAGYNAVSGLKLRALCWAHVRRRFVNALPKAEQNRPENSDKLAAEAIRIMAQLFKIDAELGELCPEERAAARLERETPVLEQFKTWLLAKKEVALPKSPLGDAINYALNHWDGLTAYLQDGNCSLTNNICERTVRPFTIGRKNWLFSGSVEGAKASAMVYSVAETCKLNDVSLYKYLERLLRELPDVDFPNQPELLDKYLPWSDYIQENCK